MSSDIDAVVVAILSAAATVPVSVTVPNPRPDGPFVVAYGLGGKLDLIVDQQDVHVEVWQSRRLVGDVQAALLDAAGSRFAGVDVVDVSVAAPKFFPDTDTRTDRWVFTSHIVIAAAAANQIGS